MPNIVSMKVEDYLANSTGETSRSSFNIGPLTAANFAAKHAAVDTLHDAILPLIEGEIRQIAFNEVYPKSLAAVGAQTAQREKKWRVTYRDDTEFLDVGNTINNTGYLQTYSMTLPTADLSHAAFDGQKLDLTDTEVAAFVTAFEAVQNSPTGGNTVTVLSIEYVGANL
jgi:hypothetical protein